MAEKKFGVRDLEIIDPTGTPTIESSGDLIVNAGGATERLRVTSAGAVQIANGNLVFSTSGTGIDFSATSDAGGMTSELLDDYEEGTWTPGFQLGSQSGSFTFTGNNGARYTKIGRVVHVNGIIEWSNHNLTAGVNLQVTGLPFTTSASSNKDRSGISISYAINAYTGITVYQQALRSEVNATYMTFNYSNATDGSIDNVPNYNHINTSGTFIFFGMYIV